MLFFLSWHGYLFWLSDAFTMTLSSVLHLDESTQFKFKFIMMMSTSTCFYKLTEKNFILDARAQMMICINSIKYICTSLLIRLPHYCCRCLSFPNFQDRFCRIFTQNCAGYNLIRPLHSWYQFLTWPIYTIPDDCVKIQTTFVATKSKSHPICMQLTL